MKRPITDETREKKRIRDARYRRLNCGRIQKRIKFALRKLARRRASA